jgi:hypothetical protein
MSLSIIYCLFTASLLPYLARDACKMSSCIYMSFNRHLLSVHAFRSHVAALLPLYYRLTASSGAGVSLAFIKFLYMYMNIYTYMYKHLYIYRYTYTYTYVYTDICVYSASCSEMDSEYILYIFIHIYTFIYVHMYIHIYLSIYLSIHARTHARAHTHTHTFMNSARALSRSNT